MIRPGVYQDVSADPHAAKYVRPFIGAKELLYGTDRWCLWLADLESDDLKKSALLRERLEGVRKFRLKSTKQLTRDGADTPGLFQQVRQPDCDYLAIPRHVGQSRRFFPVQRYTADVIVGDHNFIAEDPDGYVFALLSSSMFVTWMKGVAGRIRADPRFSGTGVWNTFPLPELNGTARERVIDAGLGVLEARRRVDDTLDGMYEPDNMKPALLKAHRTLDSAVDGAFVRDGGAKPKDNSDRLGVLFSWYIELAALRAKA